MSAEKITRIDGGHNPKKSGPHFSGPRSGSEPYTDREAALVIHRLVAGREASPDDFERMPTKPVNWSGLASIVAGVPIEGRAEAVERFLIDHVQAEAVEAMRQALAETADESPVDEAPPPKKRRMRLIDADVLDDFDFRPEWLIEGALVARQPCLLGASKKGMKTSLAIDLAISLASGLPFLGHFSVPKRVKTILLSGESGGQTIQETSRRVCEQKGINLKSLAGHFRYGDVLPRLSCDEDLEEMADFIRETETGLVIIDPLYLCLASGSSNGKAVDMANLFEVGPLLLKVARTCLDAGATPLLLHHYKLTGLSEDGKPDLSNLAFAGIQEFARQWILLSRREKYVPGTGKHELWLTVGGSAGHSGEWALDILEGVINTDFAGRFWEPTLRSESEVITEAVAVKAAKARDKQLQAELAKAATHRDHEEKVLDALRKLGGQATRSAAYGNAGLNSTNGNAALNRLLCDGRIEVCTINEKGAKGVRIVAPDNT